MAVAVTTLGTLPSSPIVPGSFRRRVCKVTFDSTYPSGGEPVTAAMFGLTTLDAVIVAGTTVAGRLAAFDAANSKILVFKAVLTENDVADISADHVIVEVIGR